jgi:exonuclease III
MRIISYNVNGIRAAIGKGMMDWLRSVDPDIVCFQEIKAQEDQIPVGDERQEFKMKWLNARERNMGWRIDYHMVSDPLENRMKGVSILPAAIHSDHCPVLLDIEFN